MIDNIVNKVLFLMPDAQFCVRSQMTNDDIKAAEMANESIHAIADAWILWSSLNKLPFPGVDAVNAVTPQQVSKAQEKARKKIRNSEAKFDLAIVSNFKVAKQQNSLLKFSDYLDGLENDAANIDPEN